MQAGGTEEAPNESIESRQAHQVKVQAGEEVSNLPNESVDAGTNRPEETVAGEAPTLDVTSPIIEEQLRDEYWSRVEETLKGNLSSRFRL